VGGRKLTSTTKIPDSEPITNKRSGIRVERQNCEWLIEAGQEKNHVKMSVARPSETGCRLVRIKRVPSSEFHHQHPISVTRKTPTNQHQPRYLPPITLRNSSAPSGVNRIWINQRHSDAWYSANRFAAVAESSPYHHQVRSS
jgi:hypothetical protein